MRVERAPESILKILLFGGDVQYSRANIADVRRCRRLQSVNCVTEMVEKVAVTAEGEGAGANGSIV